ARRRLSDRFGHCPRRRFQFEAPRRTIGVMSKSASLVLLLSRVVSSSTAHTPHEVRVASPLLDGQELFGETIPAAQEVDILEVSPEMAEFVTANGRAMAVDWLRMKRLINGMADAGYLDLQYEAGQTFTASETFRGRA